MAGRFVTSLATREALAHSGSSIKWALLSCMTASQPWQDLSSSALAGVGVLLKSRGDMGGGTVGKGRGIRNTLLS